MDIAELNCNGLRSSLSSLYTSRVNAALGRAKDMKTLTKPLAKMPAGAMFLGGSRKPDTAITQPIQDYVIPFLPIFQDCESDFRYSRTSKPNMIGFLVRSATIVLRI